MSEEPPAPHRRRPRYSGKNPRRFEEKYKELAHGKYPETVAKVLAAGKTPAGMHVPIMVEEILAALDLRPGKLVVDCTLGFGGHARAMLERIVPGGRLLGLDVDPVEQPRTELRLRNLGFGPDVFAVRRANFAGLRRALDTEGLAGADAILADLGVSSMQLDTPSRGFSMKISGPLDMRMNPNKGQPAADWIAGASREVFADALTDNADEPRAGVLSQKLAGRRFSTTSEFADAIRSALRGLSESEREKSVRRVFQAVRIAVNDEFAVLETLLRQLPDCLAPGGRAAILTFHSGEDRRVKKAFQSGFHEGLYSRVSDEVIRPSPEESRANPRSTSAKLRWACR